MKKFISLLLLLCSLCALFPACSLEQKPFAHALKTGRYRTDEHFKIENLEITHFQIELTDGDMMQYVKTDGESMIKDLFTVKERFQTVLRVNLTMCINGEEEKFRFDGAKALNRKTETEYQVSGVSPWHRGEGKEYPALDSFVMTTMDGDGDGVAEKLHIKIGETEFDLENNDILYRFTLRDDKGVFGTEGVRDLTYYDYQTVELCDYDVVSFMHDGSYEEKYRMPIITLSTGEVLTPELIKRDGGTIGAYWLFSFPMPSSDICGVVSEIEVDKKTYKVTVDDHRELLYEQPKTEYRAGERVVIKTHILTDVDVECFVNGISIGKQTTVETDGRYTHWEYYFEMPAEDVIITFALYGGM